jgi:branched-chain amino acid transport system permease protein
MKKIFGKSTFRLILYAALLYALVMLLSQVIPVGDGFVLNSYFMIIINISLVYVILATSLNLINGITGQFSIGHMGFAAIGAYVSGTLTTLIWKLTPGSFSSTSLFIVALVVGGIGAAIVGLLIGMPTLRLKGDYLAIVTLGFGEIIRTIINNIDYVGGPRGLLGIPQLSNFTIIFIIALLTIMVLRYLVFSSHGRAMISIREDATAADLVGVNTTKYKVWAFVIGAFFAGVGGGLLAHMIQLAHPTQYNFYTSFLVLMIVYIGGMGSMTGSIIAAFILTFLEKYILPMVLPMIGLGVEWRMVIYAVLLIVIMIYRPEGLMNREAKFMIPEDH